MEVSTWAHRAGAVCASVDSTGGVKAKLLRATAELTALDLGVSLGISLESHVCDMS